jgi:hypothetical protein
LEEIDIFLAYFGEIQSFVCNPCDFEVYFACAVPAENYKLVSANHSAPLFRSRSRPPKFIGALGKERQPGWRGGGGQ